MNNLIFLQDHGKNGAVDGVSCTFFWFCQVSLWDLMDYRFLEFL